jgi:hypothetical protein
MNINILKRGTVPTKVMHYGTCRNCNSELSWEAKDGDRGYFNPISGADGSRVTCPVCSESVIGYEARMSKQ